MTEYKEYIKSSIPWISKIPSHWKVIRGKNLYKKMQRPVYSNDEVVTCFRDGTVTLRKNRRTTGFTESLKEIGYQGIRKGDLVIHVMDAFAGAIGVSDSDGKGTPVYSVCQAKGNSNNQYYAHLLRIMAQKGFIQSLYRGIRERSSDFRFEVFASQFYPVPPRAEQDQIVRFLDWKVSCINKLIKIKKKQINLLIEQEKRIISDSVLLGLKGTKLKDTGNRWISKIPLNWELIKLGKFCSFQNGISESGDFFTSGTPFVGYSDVYRHLELPIEIKGVAKSDKQQQEIFSVKKGDIFFTRTSENIEEIGMAAVCKQTIEKAVFSGFIIRCRPRIQLINIDFIKYYLQIPAIRNHFSSMMNIVIRASLSQYLLKQMPVVIPPIEEQKEIAIYLNEQHLKYISLKETIQKQIETLKALKTRLISDVVTGKIDVRDIEIPDYEFVAEEQTESSTETEQTEEQED